MLNEYLLRAFASAQNPDWQEDSGQTAAEYSLMITVVAVAVILLATIAFRGAIASLFTTVSGCFDGVC